MASRPLFNGSAKVAADNNAAPALLNRFIFRVSVGALDATEDVGNATFQAEANTAIVLNYEIKKTGAGVEADTPTDARIRIFNDNDNDGLRTGFVFESADLINAALPQSGTYSFTPTQSGTYRIQLEMQKGNGDFGNTSTDWRLNSDALTVQRGALSTITTAQAADKGRIRAGQRSTAINITERTNSAPALFTFTANAVETVRMEFVNFYDSNKTTATEAYKFKHRRNGTSTIDANVISSRISSTVHRADAPVTLINFPLNNAATTYDSQIVVENNSALHTNNTPQYSGLIGAAASGIWTFFYGVGAGLTLTDFQTITKLSTHIVNPGGQIENIFAKKSETYTESGGIPQGGEDNQDYIATADNMTVKSGRVLNARGEAVSGVFILTEVIHEASGSERTEWGRDSGTFATVANGWQGSSQVVAVSTPPSGVHKVVATAYFPSGTEGAPASRQFSQTKTEQGTPAGVNTGKNWIAPASFANAEIVVGSVVTAGQNVPFTVHVFDKNIERDADSTPTVTVYRNRAGDESAPFATPVLTKRAGTTGIYDGSFTSQALTDPSSPDTYEIKAVVTVGSFTRSYSQPLIAAATNPHTGHEFDPIGLFS